MSTGGPRPRDRDDVLTVEGVVVDLVHGFARVEYKLGAGRAREALCKIGGKMRLNHVRVMAGDRVTCELSAYDMTRGRITFRHRS